MDRKDLLISKEQLPGVYKTILMFLENQNFRETCAAFKKDASISYEDIPKITTKAILLKPLDEQCDQIEISVSSKSINKEREHFNDGPPPVYSKFKEEWKENDNFDGLKNKFQVLQEEHKKLMAVATELTTALHNNVMGQTEHMNKMLESCKNIYPDLFVNSLNGTPSILSPTVDIAYEKEQMEDSSIHESDNVYVLEPSKLNEVHNSYSSLISPREIQQEVKVETDDLKKCSSAKRNAEEIVNIVINSAVKTPDEEKPLSSAYRLESIPQNISSKEKVLNTELNSAPSDSTIYLKCAEDGEWTSSNDLNNADPRLNNSLQNLTIETHKATKEICDESLKKLAISESDNSNDQKVKDNRVVQQLNNYCNLNFSLIKRDLIKSSIEIRKNLLKSLRLVLTTSETSEIRDHIIECFVGNDLLMLINGQPNNLIDVYLTDENISVQESMARMTNTFASLRRGRDYLCVGECRVLENTLLPQILGHKRVPVNVKFDMLIATLQKLSMEKTARITMVRAGLFQYLVDYCHDTPVAFLSDYRWEYLTSWLMNLCLEAEARDICKQKDHIDKIVQIIKMLLDYRKYNCLPYVNGIMYSLLTDPQVNKKTRELRLADIIALHINNESLDENSRNQLQFILRSRLTDSIDYTKLSNDINLDCQDANDEADLLEPELDIGDDFCEADVAILDSYKIQTASDFEIKSLCRPITPNLMKRQTKSFNEVDVDSNADVKHSNDLDCNCDMHQSSPNMKHLSPRSPLTSSSQFQHRLSSRRVGIFERARRNYSKPPLLKMSAETGKQMARKRDDKGLKLFGIPINARSKMTAVGTPLCYMELCNKLAGGGALCTCSKCSGGSRYSCGCYEILKRDLEEDSGKHDHIFASKNLPKLRTGDRSMKQEWYPYTFEEKKWTRNCRGDSFCSLCGEQLCECAAFEPKPKIKRTPP